MALDFIERGDLASPKNIKAQKVATWPIGQLSKVVPNENSGGGVEVPTLASKKALTKKLF